MKVRFRQIDGCNSFSSYLFADSLLLCCTISKFSLRGEGRHDSSKIKDDQNNENDLTQESLVVTKHKWPAHEAGPLPFPVPPQHQPERTRCDSNRIFYKETIFKQSRIWTIISVRLYQAMLCCNRNGIQPKYSHRNQMRCKQKEASIWSGFGKMKHYQYMD